MQLNSSKSQATLSLSRKKALLIKKRVVDREIWVLEKDDKVVEVKEDDYNAAYRSGKRTGDFDTNSSRWVVLQNTTDFLTTWEAMVRKSTKNDNSTSSRRNHITSKTTVCERLLYTNFKNWLVGFDE